MDPSGEGPTRHTIVLGDVHLADGEPEDPKRPLWKRFKRPELFVDESFARFLAFISERINGPIELVLNGDFFDFDSVTALPEKADFRIGWLERKRGLNSEEPKSRFKIRRILQDHHVLVDALRAFLLQGNEVVFVMGNHDMELHWPSVQREILAQLDLPEPLRANVRFPEWFYISNGDTLIEHGSQYDAYCVCANPLFPLIRKGSRKLVRLPFGNLAGRYMTNGMGLFNPHVESSYIMSLGQYLRFFFRYLIRIQPFLLWTWFWGACLTLVISIREGLMPAYRNPMILHRRIEEVAARARASPEAVMSMRELHAHPAIFSPFRVLRELWLDRAFLLVLILIVCFQIFSVLNVFSRASSLWFWIPLALFMPALIFYAQSVTSDVYKVQKAALSRVPACARIARVKRVVHGHTHREMHRRHKGVEVLNNGTWSAAYQDVECTRPSGRKCFTWIRPAPPAGASDAGRGAGRVATLYAWRDPGVMPIQQADEPRRPWTLPFRRADRRTG